MACSAERRHSVRKGFDVSEDTVLIATTGRIHPYKRFDFIVDAGAEVGKIAPHVDMRMILISDGPALPTIREQVRSMGLESTVHLLGYRNDVRDLLCASHIAMHAALGEGFSLAILEYMSAGLPVLVPDIPSVRQAVDHDETGFLYASHDRAAAAKQLAELALDKKRRLAMGKAAKQRPDASYSLDACTKAFISALRW